MYAQSLFLAKVDIGVHLEDWDHKKALDFLTQCQFFESDKKEEHIAKKIVQGKLVGTLFDIRD